MSGLPKIDDEIRVGLEEPIGMEEIECAINNLTARKTPGPDGLGAQFYKHFKKHLVIVLFKLIGEAYRLEALPLSFLRTHTVLVPKSEDQTKLRYVSGYRPITLCNIDYKIFMKILTSRLQTVIGDIVGDTQTCGIKGRSIQTNIHVARSILEICTDEQRHVAVLQIDLAKAFDKVQHSFLFAVLSHVGVGSVIFEGVRMAYKGCATKLIVNRSLSENILLKSSVRQGCPLSPLLFALYLEPFCRSITMSRNVRGFSLNATEVKVLAYADDIAVFCVDKKSVSEAVTLTHKFCEISGAEVNLEKCSGFWHGTWATTPTLFAGIHWSVLPCKYLGVPLNQYKNSKPYWCNTAVALKEKTSNWCNRELSIFARATVCNVFLVAKLFYVLQVLHCARSHIQKFHRIFAVFIWKSQVEPIRRDNLFRRVHVGGLGLTHLFVRQIISRFFFLMNVQHPFLREVAQRKLANHLPFFLVSTECFVPQKVSGF